MSVITTSVSVDRFKNIIGGQDFVINEKLKIRNPTLGDIMDFGEERYLTLVSLVVARPYDFMVLLDDNGINYMEVDEFELFCMNIRSIEHGESQILFGGLDFTAFEFGENQENDELVFFDHENGIVIDRFIYANIVQFVREINVISADIEFKAGNERMRQSLIDRARRKQKKHKNRPFESQLSNLVSFAVNNEGFKYNYQNVMELKISQFYDAFYRLNKIENYRQTMSGVYAGTIQFEKLDKKLLNWTGDLMVSQSEIDKGKEQLEPTKK